MADRGSPAPVLRASEVGHYAFCHRAWWLHRVQGVPMANVRELEAGTAEHAAHGRRVVYARALQWLALALVLLAAAAVVAGLLLR